MNVSCKSVKVPCVNCKHIYIYIYIFGFGFGVGFGCYRCISKSARTLDSKEYDSKLSIEVLSILSKRKRHIPSKRKKEEYDYTIQSGG